MRRVLLTTISLLAFTATAAVAADLPRAMPAKAPAFVPVGYNWTGFYLGINGGYGWGSSRWNGFGSSTILRRHGRWHRRLQLAGHRQPWVFGLEGDIDWTNIKGTFVECGLPDRLPDQEQLARQPCAAASATPGTASCLTSPAALRSATSRPVTGFAGVNDTNVGWTAGGGIEAALAGNWTAKLEYLHVDLGHINCAVGSVLAADPRRFPCRRSPRRRELPVLIAASIYAKAPDENRPGLLAFRN